MKVIEEGISLIGGDCDKNQRKFTSHGDCYYFLKETCLRKCLDSNMNKQLIFDPWPWQLFLWLSHQCWNFKPGGGPPSDPLYLCHSLKSISVQVLLAVMEIDISKELSINWATSNVIDGGMGITNPTKALMCKSGRPLAKTTLRGNSVARHMELRADISLCNNPWSILWGS